MNYLTRHDHLCGRTSFRSLEDFITLGKNIVVYSRTKKLRMTNQETPQEEQVNIEEDENQGLPSLFKNWNQMYAFVLGELALLVGLFYWFTKAFE